ncbi:hypothetical protein PINS_up004431 [Pythium insidiosum]|nr:hypothetical protein PINS_up004431 [Pythium insidiosum]
MDRSVPSHAFCSWSSAASAFGESRGPPVEAQLCINTQLNFAFQAQFKLYRAIDMKIIATTRGVLPLALYGALLSSTSDAATCKRLIDKDNTFLSSLLLIGNITQAEADSVHVETLFAPLDKMFPWLSTCVASLEPVSLMASVMANPNYAKCMDDKKKDDNGGYPDDNGEKGGDKAMTDSEIRERVCADYDRQVMGCLKDVLIPAAAATMESNACCADMKSTISTSFGTDLVTMSNLLFRQVGNVICTTKTYTNSENQQVTESCGHSLMSALFTDASNPNATMSNAVQMMQVPSDQVCKAMTGQSFKTTTGETKQFDWGKGGVDGVGICYQPVGQLIDTVSQYPVVKTTKATVDGTSVPMSDLFTPGKCLSGQVVVKWLLADDGMVMKLAQLVDDTNAVGP